LHKKSIKLCGVAIFSNTCQLVGFSVNYLPLASPNEKSAIILKIMNFMVN